MFKLTQGLALLALLAFTSPAYSQAWHQRPGTDHWYARDLNFDSPQWHQDNAISLGATLACCETQAEIDWIENTLPNLQWAWIGLYQDVNDPDFAEPGGGWKWINDAPLSYDHWNGSDPDNLGFTNQEANWGACDINQNGRYCDTSDSIALDAIYEMQSIDCDNNSIPDTLEIALNSALDANGDGLLDSCLLNVTWQNRAGTNDWYSLSPFSMYWEEHRTNAETLGCSLVIIEDQAENDWIEADLIMPQGPGEHYIGLYQTPGSIEPAGGWVWIDGSIPSYTNWAPNEPNDCCGGQDYCTFSTSGFLPSGSWDDSNPETSYPGIYEVHSDDCDGNGVPDTYESHIGSATDTNNNGIIDVCETVLTGLTWTNRSGTDNWYAITGPGPSGQYSWDFGRTMASNVGADLAVISNATEEQWIIAYNVNNGDLISWIGLYQDHSSPTFAEPGGGWKWTNPSNNYNTWAPGEPNDWASGEDHGSIRGNGIHDALPLDRPCIFELQSFDCDDNGIPDAYEIVLDPSLDADSDGIIDSCWSGGPFTWEEDCNGNGVWDSFDIASGGSTDYNADGRPDECTPFDSIHRVHEGALSDSTFTMAITSDLDGDSINDYLIADASFDLPNAANTGKVHLRSGADGSLLKEWVSSDNPSYADLALGFSLDASGDWDGDGTNDILIGAPGYSGTQTGGTLSANGAAFIYSGASPDSLLTVIYGIQNGQNLGYSVCFLGDSAGNDGRDEFAVSSPFATNLFGGLGLVSTYQGGTTTIINDYYGFPGDLYGAKIISGGDLDGDGHFDLLVGAPGDDTQGPGTLQDGRVEILSGTGSVLGDIHPVANWSSYTGAALAMLDDLNNDGRAEFVVGSPRYSLLNGQGVRAGKCSVYQYSPSSPNGSTELIFEYKGLEAEDNLGVSLARIGDVNGDGISEFAVGVPGARAPMQPAGTADDVGKVVVIDPMTQEVVREIGGRHLSERFGYVLAGGAGDLNSDGVPDLIAGNRNASGAVPYAWITSSTQSLLGNYYCEPNEQHDTNDDDVLEIGLRALISASGTTNLSAPGGSLTLKCNYMPSNKFGIFYHGSNTMQTLFGDIGGLRCVAGGINRLPILNSGPNGQMVLNIDYAGTTAGFNPALLAGQTRHFQCWFREAPGSSGHFNLSDAVTLTFQ